MLTVTQFVYIVCPSGGLPKYSKTTKVLTTYFDLIKRFFEKEKEGRN